ncbi:MAG TPA: DNA translocase FtsK, partial [Bacillales bacterium]
MTNSLWERFLNLFTEEIVEEETWRPERRTGRIEEGHRGAQPRMLSHYPKAKHVRVPIIEDHKGEMPVRSRQQRKNRLPKTGEAEKRSVSPNRKRPSPSEEKPERGRERFSDQNRAGRRGRRSSPEKDPTPPDRPKFTGVDFHASDVPSPVHGFRKRQVSERRSRDQSGLKTDSRTLASLEKGESGDERERRVHSLKDREERRKDRRESSPEKDGNSDRNASSLEHLYFYGYSADANDEVLSDHTSEIAEVEEVEVIEREASGVEQNKEPERVPNEIKTEESEELTGTVTEQHLDIEEPKPNEEDAYIAGSTDKELAESVPYNVVMLKSDKETADHSGSPRIETGESRLPPIDLLSRPQRQADEDDGWITEQRERLAETLENFNVNAEVVGVTKGPA